MTQSICPESNRIFLKEEQKLVVEPRGMLACQNVSMKTEFVKGSILERAKRYLIGGEPIFSNTFTALKSGGWVALEEHMPGQIIAKTLSSEDPALMIRRTALLAHSPEVEMETIYQGLSGYLQGKGIANIRSFVKEGKGEVYFHAHDGIVRVFHVHPESGPVTIDNDMILAYSESLKCELQRPKGGVVSLLFSGEGLTCEFQGEGSVYVASGTQTGSDTFPAILMRETASKIAETVVNIAALGIFISAVGLGVHYGFGVSSQQMREFLKNHVL